MTTSKKPSDIVLEQIWDESWVKGLNHLSLHVRDLDEAVRFWVTLFNGKPHLDQERGKRVFHVMVSGIVFAFFEREGLIGWDHEYPHYAFTVSSEGARNIKWRLEQADVKTHSMWTRGFGEALMYFRDPTGNLFELYCPGYDKPDELEKANGRGGTFVPPIGDLKYDWRG